MKQLILDIKVSCANTDQVQIKIYAKHKSKKVKKTGNWFISEIQSIYVMNKWAVSVHQSVLMSIYAEDSNSGTQAKERLVDMVTAN